MKPIPVKKSELLRKLNLKNNKHAETNIFPQLFH